MSWRMTDEMDTFPILGLLRDFQATQCSDDRDRIYALLSLSDDLVPLHSNTPPKQHSKAIAELAVGYNDDVENVYISLATKLTERGQDFNLHDLLGPLAPFGPHIPRLELIVSHLGSQIGGVRSDSSQLLSSSTGSTSGTLTMQLQRYWKRER